MFDSVASSLRTFVQLGLSARLPIHKLTRLDSLCIEGISHHHLANVLESLPQSVRSLKFGTLLRSGAHAQRIVASISTLTQLEEFEYTCLDGVLPLHLFTRLTSLRTLIIPTWKWYGDVPLEELRCLSQLTHLYVLLHISAHFTSHQADDSL